MATTMEKERLYNLITYIGTRLSRSISVEYFNNLMNTLLSHNDAKQALILFMVHLKMMAKWLIIRNSIANEIIEKVIQIYNTTNDQEKVEVP